MKPYEVEMYKDEIERLNAGLGQAETKNEQLRTELAVAKEDGRRWLESFGRSSKEIERL
ncbi:MAG: hypothetical protein ACRDIC_06020 [bacterium]